MNHLPRKVLRLESDGDCVLFDGSVQIPSRLTKTVLCVFDHRESYYDGWRSGHVDLGMYREVHLRVTHPAGDAVDYPLLFTNDPRFELAVRLGKLANWSVAKVGPDYVDRANRRTGDFKSRYEKHQNPSRR